MLVVVHSMRFARAGEACENHNIQCLYVVSFAIILLIYPL
jgi:hypothetical protein